MGFDLIFKVFFLLRIVVQHLGYRHSFHDEFLYDLFLFLKVPKLMRMLDPEGRALVSIAQLIAEAAFQLANSMVRQKV